MNSYRPFRRFVALIVIFTFFGLIQAASMPLGAADTAAVVSAASETSDSPGSIESTGTQPKSGKKSALVPILIGVLAAGAIAAVLIFVVFKTSYEIMGEWNVSFEWTSGPDSGYAATVTFTFSGSKESGTLTSSYGDTGTYTVDGKDVTWTLTNFTGFTWRGTFTDKNAMSGTMEWTSEGDGGTWSATRTTTTAATGKKPSPAFSRSSWKKQN